MPELSNNYLACHLLNLDPEDSACGPFVVAQMGYDPLDELMIEIVYLLRRDGSWIDEVSQSKLSEVERFRVFHDSPHDVMTLLESLCGEPKVERSTLTADDLKARIADLKGGSFVAREAIIVEHYREWKRSTQR